MMRKLLFLPLVALGLASCGMMSALGPPPQASPAMLTISRSALDFALHSFDAALYGIDAMLDTGRITPGSDNARRLAAAGRRVMNFLGAAEAARDLGSAPTYEEAFRSANEALTEFRQLLGMAPAAAAAVRRQDLPPLTNTERWRILERLERPATL